MVAGLTSAVKQWGANWALRRQGSDQLPLRLNRRRVYILPGKTGLVFALMLLAMLLASMNYSNSMGFALTFLLASLALVAMHHCYSNLVGTTVQAIAAEPVFAGEEAIFEILINNPGAATRFELRAGANDELGAAIDVAPGRNAVIALGVPAEKRGRLRISRYSLSTRFPLHLFRSWTWIHQTVDCLVFPAPAPQSGLPANQPGMHGGGRTDSEGADDFSGLRTFRPGDSPRHIAWKALAREQELLIKQFEGGAGQELWLDWSKTGAAETEARLSRLCRWVLDADKAGRQYGLRIPGCILQPANGEEHRHQCLRALALYQGTPS